MISGAALLCKLHYVSNQMRSLGFRGPPWAPEGRKSADQKRTRINRLIFPKVCQVLATPPNDGGLVSKSPVEHRLLGAGRCGDLAAVPCLVPT